MSIAANTTTDVIEGFLCPICLQDLTSIAQLQVHFEEAHGSEDRAVLNSIKLPQRSYTSLFKNIRSDRIDAYVAETNKLLLRLDKLLTDMPSDPVKRKAHERRLVPWVEDDAVPLCPDCGRPFNTLTRRRHHCRLCGAVLCQSCSSFISMQFAKKLVAPVHVAESLGSIRDHDKGHSRSPSRSSTSLASLVMPGLRRSGSQGSLNSLVSMIDSLTGEQHFRVCRHCDQRVCVRDRAVELRQSKPLLSLLYGKLMTDRTRLLQLLPQYRTMSDSLWAGDSAYHLRDAADLRLKLVRLGDSINATAQKIRSLGPVYDDKQVGSPDGEDEEVPPGPRQALLQRRIHQSATSFLKTQVLTLDKLPDPDKLQQLQITRREEATRRLAAEREAAELAEQRAELALQRIRRKDTELMAKRKEASPAHSTKQMSSQSSGDGLPGRHFSSGSRVVVSHEDGWGGDAEAHVVTATDEPVIQQMNIIRNYIRQAREAARLEEMKTLEANLKELQEEYRRQLRDKLC